ncbi:glutamine--scyllo-inositol aminotransferase [Desulfomarina profundi]|uniref:Glutamine--scyllo-inositol aminotransferase n=1 Tax=Desulfomarina profundi TaxID=2772557 RepID=A0A8D5FHX7_9BACT|nr:DegT/DnrJ/EryC1/StrS family aminotransferase [Desulfomarina profundi]BCL61015.1 glutamine--scyllo-inositol aminotransferase [Desulfomarina profundi]
MIIPFLDLAKQHQTLRSEILQEWEKILLTAGFIGGEYVEGFEHDFAAACGVKYCVSVGSGTDALRFILLALGVGPGDEVIVPVNTFIATSEAVSQAGATVRFVDIDPFTYNIDPGKIETAITEKTKGIIAVHLYGQPADMDTVQEIAEKYQIWVVEDSCQAHLAEYKDKKVGGFGVAAAFSFYPGKNLGACGEAGAVTTNNCQLAQKITALRNHGQSRKYVHDMEGYNGRCDALQAAALQIKLKYLSRWNALRRKHARMYDNLLDSDDLVTPYIREDVVSVYHLYVVLVSKRKRIADYLAEHGITTGLHYPVPLHLQKAYSCYSYKNGDFPVSEECAGRLLSLPMYPELSEDDIEFVCNKLKEAVKLYA